MSTMNTQRVRGFTLVELMITIMVFGIIMGLAVPSMQQMVVNNRLSTQTNNFVGALQYARSEALKRRTPVALRPTSGTTDWAQGWSIWVDPNNLGTEDAGEVVLKVEGAISGGLTLNAATASAIVYRANGVINADICPANANFSFCANLCKAAGKPGRQVFISSTGRPEIVTEYTCP
jgi:type IV fimbrial biogenesis protein FimT